MKHNRTTTTYKDREHVHVVLEEATTGAFLLDDPTYCATMCNNNQYLHLTNAVSGEVDMK